MGVQKKKVKKENKSSNDYVFNCTPKRKLAARLLSEGTKTNEEVADEGSVAKIILLPFWAITIAFCIIIDLFMAYKYPICDVFRWFCKIARFFATEPTMVCMPQFHLQCKGN